MSKSAPEPGKHRAAGATRSRRERARTVAFVGLAIVLTVFAVRNSEKVKVDWIVATGESPLIIVVISSALVGAVLTYFAQRRAGSRREDKRR